MITEPKLAKALPEIKVQKLAYQDFKNYYKAIVIMTMWFWYNAGLQTDKNQRGESTQTPSLIHKAGIPDEQERNGDSNKQCGKLVVH